MRKAAGIDITAGDYGWQATRTPTDIEWRFGPGQMSWASIGAGALDGQNFYHGLQIASTGTAFGDGYINLISKNGAGAETGRVTIQSGNLSATGNVSASGSGSFGAYAVIGTSVPGGYYQDANNGAYRALGATGNRGFYFQSYNGAGTTMFVGLVGTGAGQVGIGTTAPTAGYALDVNGAAYVRGNSVIGGLQYLAAQGSGSAPTIANFGVATFVVLHSTNNRRYVIAYNDNGTVKFRWMDLNLTGAPVWNYSTNWNDVID